MDQQPIWDYYQNEAPEAFLGSRKRLQFLAKKLTPKGKVLNIGVGGGNFEEIAVQQSHTVYSLDPDEETIENLRQRFDMGDKARIGVCQKIPFPDQLFDNVVISEVIEHLANEAIKRTLKEISRVLVADGCLIGTVPAREDIRSQTVICPHCGERFHRWGHLQSFSLEQIEKLLVPYFEILELFERPFFDLSLMNWKGKIHGIIRILMYYAGIHSINEHIVFIAKNNRAIH